MTRSRVKASNAVATVAAAFALVAATLPAGAQTAAGDRPVSPNYWFAGTRLAFDRPQYRGAAFAVSTDDTGLGRFLSKLNATLSYQPGQSYVVVTSGDRRTITFTIGDPHYDVAGVKQFAEFAPYVSGGAAYLPFADLANALEVSSVNDGGTTTVLQPQIATLDVRPAGRATIVTLRGASTLHFKRLTAVGDAHLTLAFTGIASTLEHDRQIAGVALQGVAITAGGTPRNPTTVVDFETTPGSAHVLVPSDSPDAISIAFAPLGVSLGGTAIPATGDATVATTPLLVHDPRDGAAPPSGAYRGAQIPVPAPQSVLATPADPNAQATPTALGLQPATLTDLHLDPSEEGLSIALGISGPVTYEWHRLSDNRWYVDLKPATLGLDAQDVPIQNAAVTGLRIKGFVGPNDRLPTVRVALTLATPRIVTLVGTSTGMLIAVDRLDDLDPQRVGRGELTNGNLVASIVPLPTVAAPPPSDGSGAPPPDAWKFSPAPPPGTNPRLIVIDPGHGGSDSGAEHNGLTEKTLTLDMSRRLRTALVARGWIVKMTRDSDVDVYAPNDSGKEELQARDDVANNLGARLLISVHVNAFTTTELNGTTTYYYKSDSYGFAQAVHARLAAMLPTKDDGIVKENFYVIHHATAPAILVETAFVSNPGDAELLRTDAFRQKVASAIAAGVGDYATPAQPLSSTGDAPSSDGN
jgi:N-acetylmuramoyl-L-alanine amidase